MDTNMAKSVDTKESKQHKKAIRSFKEGYLLGHWSKGKRFNGPELTAAMKILQNYDEKTINALYDLAEEAPSILKH
jgi:hypothetical protein